MSDPLIVYDRERNVNAGLRNMLTGVPAAFLVCGGPSANALPLEELNRKGIFSMAVNNMAGHPRFRPSSFVCSDPPSKFHTGIWYDPGTLKLIPRPKLHQGRGRIRRKLLDGTFEPTGRSTLDCPNVWAFDRRNWILPDDTFFTDPQASWGNLDVGVERTGGEKTVCTMLLAIRLLHYLGAKRIYLVGVDFFMDGARARSDRYAFPQDRDSEAMTSNNRQFGIVNEWLCKMQADGVFEKYNLELFNCYEMSGLRAFSFVSFEDAIADALHDYPVEPFDLSNWYEKK